MATPILSTIHLNYMHYLLFILINNNDKMVIYIIKFFVIYVFMYIIYI